MEKARNKKILYSTKWIAYTAVLTALVIASSVIPPVQILAYNVYWCDGVILLGAYLMDPVSAFIIGGLGSALYDFGVGHVQMAVASLIIHGLQAVVTSALLHCVFNKFKREALWAFVSSVVGALIVIGGYWLTYWLIFPLVMGKYGWIAALERVPRNIIQEIIGIAIAMVLCYATTFKKQLEKSRLLPDFKREILARETAVCAVDGTAAADGENSENIPEKENTL